MLNLQYLNEKTYYQVEFSYVDKNHVKITGKFPIKTKGFCITRIGEPEAFTGNYALYTTVYKEIEGGAIFSNDGSVYVEPIPKVSFHTNGGGILEGETVQEVKNYEGLIIPNPVANENYIFERWSPAIPESGEINGNKTFTAIFASTLPEPEPEPTLEERLLNTENGVAQLKDEVQAINEALGGNDDE